MLAANPASLVRVRDRNQTRGRTACDRIRLFRCEILRFRGMIHRAELRTAHRAERSFLEAFLRKKAEIDNALARLRDLSDDHFHCEPDKIHWGHVGTLAHYVELLTRITDAAFHEGEHAE